MSDLISVIIPTFNRGYVLREAVDSVLDQFHREVEVIIVDDGSSDRTDELVATAYGGDARVRYLYQPNAGLASARNTGLDLATGDYVAFLDSDDSWKPWHLGLLLACLDRLPQAGMIWANMDSVDASGDIVSTASLTEFLSAYRYFSLDDLFSSSVPLSEIGIDLPPESNDRRLYVGDIFSQMIMGNLVLPSSVMIRRERLEQVGPLNERMTHVEDNEFFLRVCRAGPVAFADIAGTRYRVATSDRLSDLGGPAAARAWLQLLEMTLDRDADRITLTPALIATARVHAHRWVGELELLAGSRRVARAHLATALRLRPRQPSIVGLLALTLVPHPVFLTMVRWRRRIKARLRQ